MFSTAAVVLYLVPLSIWQIARDEGSVNERLQKHWAAMFCACYGTLFSLFIEVLAACHCCLVCKGVTTKEWVSEAEPLLSAFALGSLPTVAQLSYRMFAHSSDSASAVCDLATWRAVRSVPREPLR